MNENIFDKLDFGPLRALLDNDDITDISFDNNGQIWVRSLTQGSLRVEVNGATPEFVEKLAFQCSNVMGTTFNNAKPFLDAESAELRLNFVHPSIATNGIAMVIRKTPAKIRLQKEKLIDEDYFTQDIHDVLIKCVEGHCNIIVAGETGSGKTEFVKYLASHTKSSEKIITIEDTLELHLDKIFPQRDIVAMKTNNVASYTDVLVTCMRQNPKWILLSEVRSAEAVSAVRNSISSGHNILSTIHADKASAIPYRLYSLMETDLDVNQFLSTIYRYIQIGVHIRAYYSKERGKFHREVDEVVEFYVDENNQPQSRIIYQKQFGKEPILRKPSKHLIEYLENQNIDITAVTDNMVDDIPFKDDPDLDEEEIEENYDSEYSEEENKEYEYDEESDSEEENNEYDEEEDASEYEETDNENDEEEESEIDAESADEDNSEEESQESEESTDETEETTEDDENNEESDDSETTNSSEESDTATPMEISNNIPLAGIAEEVQVALSKEANGVDNSMNIIEPPVDVSLQIGLAATSDNENSNMTPVGIPEVVEQQMQMPQNIQSVQPINQSMAPIQQQIPQQQSVMQLPPIQPQLQEMQSVNQANQMISQMQQPMMQQQMVQPFNPQQNNMNQSGISPFMPPTNGMPPVGGV